MAEGNKKTLHIGADVEDIEFVEQFRGYCLKEDFKQKTLIERLTKWWMNLPEPIQWLIYRGKVSEAHSQIAEAASAHAAAEEDENAAASASSTSRRKPSRRSSSKSA